jgi:hypothetical protein
MFINFAAELMEIFQLFLDEDFQQWSTIDLLDLTSNGYITLLHRHGFRRCLSPEAIGREGRGVLSASEASLGGSVSRKTHHFWKIWVASDMSHFVTACHLWFDFKWYFVWYPRWSKVVTQVPRLPLGLWAMRCLGTNGWSKTWRAVVTGEGFFAPNHGWCLFCCTWSLSHG